MRNLLTQSLKQLGDTSSIIHLQTIHGGCINQAYYVQTEKREYFIKANEKVSPDFFKKEVTGLRILQQSRTVNVPEIFGEFYFEQEQAAMLLMEWIQGDKSEKTEVWLGHQLALLHQTTEKAFGLDEDNYLGSLPQINGWDTNWVSFYRDKRLKVQLELGIQRKRITGQRLKKLEKLMANLSQWLPKNPSPSLIHGDLWSGNWLVGPHGKPYLIDPAVYYAHHEIELAFTELYGGFSERLYQAYQNIQPLPLDYQDRKPLYQLYYLLVHLNLFGEGYGQSVDQILHRYV
ncbi:fructosamine kinase family protein [Thermoflavimicrobium dichotomicum]|uniref:Fructosamine-3-kinase n=1 Tax=Thermoflavimicrobium dichotomicum TaxID=46223 RepID=A0A1I3MP96_9BACL|nr:fructosamine kinase family protein [Thermoflavimicrobium dichotomicum]SFI98772.1 Fructosamine-3-kinase [Thermoflavimicrobium dichotomicum]